MTPYVAAAPTATAAATHPPDVANAPASKSRAVARLMVESPFRFGAPPVSGRESGRRGAVLRSEVLHDALEQEGRPAAVGGERQDADAHAHPRDGVGVLLDADHGVAP